MLMLSLFKCILERVINVFNVNHRWRGCKDCCHQGGPILPPSSTLANAALQPHGPLHETLLHSSDVRGLPNPQHEAIQVTPNSIQNSRGALTYSCMCWQVGFTLSRKNLLPTHHQTLPTRHRINSRPEPRKISGWTIFLTSTLYQKPFPTIGVFGDLHI